MASQPWRDRLLKELHRHGLPSSYVSRLVDELTDHAADLSMENPSMDAEQNAEARLGTPKDLAAVAKAEFGRRTFAGRHPLLTFLVAPIFAVVGTLIGTFLLIVIASYCLAWLIGWDMSGGHWVIDAMNAPSLAFATKIVVCYASIMRFVPFALSTWIFVWLGRRSGLRRWSGVACGLIALSAFLFSAKFTVGAAGISKWGWGFHFGGKIHFIQILQAAVPLALGAWMLWRRSAGRPKMLAT